MSQVTVFHYQVFPLRAAYLAAHYTMFAVVVLLVFLITMAAPIPISHSGSLGLFLLFAGLQSCFFLNRVEKAIVHDSSATLVAAIGKSLGLAIAPTAVLFVAIPELWPGWGPAASAVVLSVLVLLATRPPLQFLIKRKKMMQKQLILGSGAL